MYIRTFPLLWCNAARLRQEANMFTLCSAVTMAPGRVANTHYKKKIKEIKNIHSG